MQNEFEKQVQQKMEELSFVPSAPVWEKIEVQIRNKKDRRKAILWLPLLFLLLGGGVWWLESGTGSSLSFSSKEKHKLSSASQQTTLSPENSIGESKVKPAEQPIENKNHRTVTIIKKLPASKTVLDSKKNKEWAKENSVGLSQLHQTATMRNESVSLQRDRSGESGSVRSSTGPVLQFVQIPVSTGTIHVVPVSRNDVCSSQPIRSVWTKKPKWKIGITGSIGLSGSSRGLNIFGDGAKAAFDVSQSGLPRPPLVNYSYSSSLRKDLSFSAGVTVGRQLTDRFLLSSGLEYLFYSTRTKVGTLISNPTVNNSMFTSFSVARTFINTGGSLHDYFNEYHFIGLPLDLSYQLHKKLPLNLHTGISLQRLVKTNALQFNTHSQVYYYDKNAFHKTQLFSEFGLDYGWRIKNLHLLTGPALRYGLTETEKNSTGHHLYSVMVKARIFLQKK